VPGANPTIASYNASAVKIYNATGSLVRFAVTIFSFTLKNAPVYKNAGVVVVILKVVGLAPGFSSTKPSPNPIFPTMFSLIKLT
jgi:hypothetical protein